MAKNNYNEKNKVKSFFVHDDSYVPGTFYNKNNKNILQESKQEDFNKISSKKNLKDNSYQNLQISPMFKTDNIDSYNYDSSFPTDNFLNTSFSNSLDNYVEQEVNKRITMLKEKEII